MIKTRWNYENRDGLSQWYGHVGYHDNYIVGQWFVLNAETGAELWSHQFRRPNTVCDVVDDIIIATETRSDGPWTASFGVYGIDAQTGRLLWTNHGSGIWGKLWKYLDCVPGFTNELRDSPSSSDGNHVFTRSKRILDVRTGEQITSNNVEAEEQPISAANELYNKNILTMDSHTIVVEKSPDDFQIALISEDSHSVWRFSAQERSLYVDGNYYSYRLHGTRIFMILANAPKYVPIDPREPLIVKSNPADYQLGVLEIPSGDCSVYPLEHAGQRTECRIEDMRDSRLLVSCDGKVLTEYEVAT